ncbi:hypothetical protein GCM10009765_23630 [Fodinicola feengrottensis]|uniref:Uncharacterized protein n=2 Tax=Fodinicola feengrottensis TaxID=435914 RepID=A0ABN2GM79_9ACTN
MPKTIFEPSVQIESLLAAVASKPAASAGIRAVMERASEFRNPAEAQLTGIALDPAGREYADQLMDDYWADDVRQNNVLARWTGVEREVIIGSGFHAAAYAATRVLSGHQKPLVLERNERAGGCFAMSKTPTFFLNSRNRSGDAGLAGDGGASLNYLPGAPIQAANVSMAEYQTNTDMAFVIRLALAQFAEVLTDAQVLSVARDGEGIEVDVEGRDPLYAQNVIDARGLGDPYAQAVANGATILTFPQFMQRMATPWPLRALRRVGIVGGGDSGKCVAESLLGIAPQPSMAAAALDSVDRIDWYSNDLPRNCAIWKDEIRGRYQAIGSYLRPDRFGAQRLNVINRRATPVALPGAGLIDGRTYDLIVVCTGNTESDVQGLRSTDFYEYTTSDGQAVAQRHFEIPVFRVGPHAKLPFTRQEREDGISNIAANAASMFRTATKTATLAAILPAVPTVD